MYQRGVQCYCDNEAVVAVIGARTSKQPQLMHLLWCSLFVEAHFNTEITCRHMPWRDSELADDL